MRPLGTQALSAMRPFPIKNLVIPGMSQRHTAEIPDTSGVQETLQGLLLIPWARRRHGRRKDLCQRPQEGQETKKCQLNQKTSATPPSLQSSRDIVQQCNTVQHRFWWLELSSIKIRSLSPNLWSSEPSIPSMESVPHPHYHLGSGERWTSLGLAPLNINHAFTNGATERGTPRGVPMAVEQQFLQAAGHRLGGSRVLSGQESRFLWWWIAGKMDNNVYSWLVTENDWSTVDEVVNQIVN